MSTLSVKPSVHRLFEDAFKATYAHKARKMLPEEVLELPIRALRDAPDVDGTLAQLLDVHTAEIVRPHLNRAVFEALLDWFACQQVEEAIPCSWVRKFRSAPLQFHIDHPAQRFRTEFGPVFFRGRLDGSARVLVVGQDPSTDEVLAHRTLIGSAGQRTQLLLKKLGMTRSYLMVNTFIYGIKGTVDAEMRAISLEPPLLDYRNSIFDKIVAENSIEAIISLGNGADHALANWPGHTGFTIFELTHPTAPSGVASNWSTNFNAMHAAIAPDVVSNVDPAPFTDAMLGAGEAIPRHDLPFGIPSWHGTGGGTRSQRSGDTIISWTSPE